MEIFEELLTTSQYGLLLQKLEELELQNNYQNNQENLLQIYPLIIGTCFLLQDFAAAKFAFKRASAVEADSHLVGFLWSVWSAFSKNDLSKVTALLTTNVQINSELKFAMLMQKLLEETRNHIMELSISAYPKVSISKMSKLLSCSSEQDTIAYLTMHGWCQEEDLWTRPPLQRSPLNSQQEAAKNLQKYDLFAKHMLLLEGIGNPDYK